MRGCSKTVMGISSSLSQSIAILTVGRGFPLCLIYEPLLQVQLHHGRGEYRGDLEQSGDICEHDGGGQ